MFPAVQTPVPGSFCAQWKTSMQECDVLSICEIVKILIFEQGSSEVHDGTCICSRTRQEASLTGKIKTKRLNTCT